MTLEEKIDKMAETNEEAVRKNADLIMKMLERENPPWGSIASLARNVETAAQENLLFHTLKTSTDDE